MNRDVDLTSCVEGAGSPAYSPLESLPLHTCLGCPRRPLNLQEREKDDIEFARAEKCKGTVVVASVDVFEARALSWYLKPRSEEVDASGRAKGSRN